MCNFYGVTAAFGIGFFLYRIAIVHDEKLAVKTSNDRAIVSERNTAFVKIGEYIELHSITKELS